MLSPTQSSVAAIVGGVVAAVAVLVGVGVLVLFLRRRYRVVAPDEDGKRVRQDDTPIAPPTEYSKVVIDECTYGRLYK
jgi:hypothetical protein